MTQACRRCQWWNMRVKQGLEPLGECRRRAPTLAPDADSGSCWPTRMWPITEAVDFCGDFQRKTHRGRGEEF